MENSRFVSYIRVSSVQQGESGLGLEAQRYAVAAYLQSISGTLLKEFVEVESGGKNARSRLRAAIDACRREDAVLLIAKLDRLARNVAFISALMETDVAFRVVDHPEATKLLLHLLAAFGEHERDMIRERTRAALAAAKARGVVLGRYGREVLAPRNREEARERARALAEVVTRIKEEGRTIATTAELMNERGVPSARGGRWHPATVHKLLKRIEAISRG